jgi:hypothetical protein
MNPLTSRLHRPTRHQLVSAACFSSGSNKSIIQVTGPTEKLKSWESGAKLVKNTKMENQYLQEIRATHDPSLHVKTIEDELKGTIGKALGKQGEKVLMYRRAMEQERTAYVRLLEDFEQDVRHPKIIEAVEKHNQYRKDCLHARWELIVHRQAVGFIVGNHNYVMEKFPIGEALPTADELNRTDDGDDDDDDDSEMSPTTQKKTFGDQLDWWQRIGRWR